MAEMTFNLEKAVTAVRTLMAMGPRASPDRGRPPTRLEQFDEARMSGANGSLTVDELTRIAVDPDPEFQEQFLSVLRKYTIRRHIDEAHLREFYRLRTMRYPLKDLLRIKRYIGL
jgi:hypothetical protein